MSGAAAQRIIFFSGRTRSRTQNLLARKKNLMARLPKFLAAGAVGAAAIALVVAGAGSTGAYFTDSHNGAINASTGAVKVNVNPGDLSLNFTNLLPGEFQTQNVDYQAAGTAAEDIWLVLPTDGTADRFNGVAGTTPGGDRALGRYGHFALDAPDGKFTSFNLATAGSGTHAGATCDTDTLGHGGSGVEAATPTSLIDFCPVPKAILLSSNLTAGQGGTAKITFGFTKKLTAPQNSGSNQVAQFKIVATQVGISPFNEFNPLPLP